MRVGTPGFVAARLRNAREARGITVQSLSEMIGVSRQSISLYEGGQQTPAPAVLERIAATLGLPERHFVTPIPDMGRMRFLYRSLAAATARSRKKSERRFDWFREIVTFVDEHVEFPPQDLPPDLAVPGDPLRLSVDDIEALADELRSRWGLGKGPIPNVVALLESKGLIVTRFPLDCEQQDSFCAHAADLPIHIVLNAEKSFAARARLDAAHELGHAVLHRGRAFSAADHAQAEAQAFRFGAAFLFPKASFLREAVSVSLPALTSLKKRWNVSIKMMIQRSIHLDLVDEEHAGRLWRYYSSRGLNREEPFDREIPLEQPRLLAQAFQMIVDEGLATKQQILEELPFTSREIEELASLPIGFFPTDLAPVIELRPRSQGSLFGTERPDGDNLLAFDPRKRD